MNRDALTAPSTARASRGAIRFSRSAAILTGALALTASAGARDAAAQVYVVAERAEPFVPLANLPGVGPITAHFTAFSSTLVRSQPIGFDFVFGGATVTNFGVSVEGWVGLEPLSTSSSEPSNVGTGGTVSFGTIIAAFWDDLSSNDARSALVGTAPNRARVIEWNDWFRAGGSSLDAGRMQVWLKEDGTVEVRYSGALVSGNYDATVGWFQAGPSGQRAAFRPCATTGTCNAADYASMVDRAFSLQPPTEPELTGAFGAFPRGAFPGATVSGQLELRNLASVSAASVQATVFLSTDAQLDASDASVGSVTTPMPSGLTSVPVIITVPAGLAAADYFLIGQVDSAQGWPEAVESDNVFVSAQRFATAHELRPTAAVAANPGGVNAGDTLNVDLTVANAGVPLTGGVEVQLFASQDALYDPADTALGSSTVTLGGGLTQTVRASATVPNLSPRTYFVVARLDPANAIAELDETNNTVVSAQPFASGPDFAIGALTIPSQAPPGSPVTITTRVDSLAVPFLGNVSYRLWASTDTALDPASDTPLGTYTIAVNGRAQVSDPQTVVWPAALAPGRYSVIAVVDPASAVAEVSEANNERVSAGTLINAFDFGVVSVTASPASLEVGANLTVSATAQSTGLTFTGDLPYRVYLSPDATFDPGDQPIYEGRTFIAGLTTAAVNVTFPLRQLPGGPALVPGSFRVVVVVDPADATLEAVETNNAAVGSSITIRGSDLLVDTLTAPPVLFAGRPAEVSVRLTNQGAATARGFRYAYYLSDNQFIRLTDQQIFLSSTATIAPGASQTFNDTVTIPGSFTSTQSLYLGVIVDIFSAVPETSESNNARGAGPLALRFPIPDLGGQVVEVAPRGAAGEDLGVTRIVFNDGVAPAAGFDYAYYLSSNPTIAVDDILLGRFTATLTEGEDDYGIDLVRIPSDVPAGTYYLGLLLDPDEVTEEVEETDNAVVGPTLEVFGATIRFLTDSLPRATLGVPYQVGVYASGGPLPISWSVSAGALPRGLNLGVTNGILMGSPIDEGNFEFTLRASSGSAFAEKAFSLRVTAPTVTLDVATAVLPTGVAGRDYRAQLIAVGGTLPYEWASLDADLPPGLSLQADGVLSGAPGAPGNLRLSVRVRDSVGNTATKELSLNVINANQTIQIVQVPLPSAIVGRTYCDPEPVQLEAMGGAPPYRWFPGGSLPEGMMLGEDGALCGTPAKVGEFPVVVRVQDAAGLFDTALFILDVDEGTDLAVSTFTLAGADQGQAYTGQLAAIRGTEPYAWSLVEGAGNLPPGLSLDAGGAISGTPTAAGSFAFTVRVTDALARTDLQPLSIRVAAPPPPVEEPADEGCSCAAAEHSGSSAEGSTLAVLALVGLLGLRRRRGSAFAALAAAVAVLGSGTAAEAQLIPGTPYQRTTGPITYADLTSPTVIWTNVDDGSSDVPLPFPFRFYETDFTSVSIGSNGALSFPSGQFISLGNQAMGTTSTPNAVIAPFWDDLILSSAMGRIGYQVEGVAPDRRITFEWRSISRFGGSGSEVSFQVRLFEGRAARFEVDYGPTNGSQTYTATMGMEDPAGARPIAFTANACGDTCSLADFQALSGRRVTLVQDPGVELIASGASAPALAFLGAESTVEARVASLHGNPIGPFTVSVIASTTRDLAGAITIGSQSLSLTPFGASSLQIPVVYPASLGEGLAYTGLVVDSGSSIMEVDEQNNRATAPSPTRLVRGEADLAISEVTLDASAVASGASLTVFARIRNAGGEPVTRAPVAVMMSTNPVISAQDVELSRFEVSLAAGETVTATRTVTIPAGTNSGNYHLGVLADPANAVRELSESNNGRAADGTVAVAGGALTILTDLLPTGSVRVTYVGLLVASGGASSNYTWDIAQGSLPAGIGLVPATGELFGRPTLAECQNFTARVMSGGETATRALTLCVSEPQAPLTLVSRAVPPAVVGQEYAFQLIATGGGMNPSYAWSATGLPDGLAMDPSGKISGSPAEAGSPAFTATVMAGANTASREFTLEVRDNANLLIIPRVLSTARFGEPYSEQLEATGGVAPFTWVRDAGSLPVGLELTPMGEIRGTPMQVGRFRLVVQARDSGAGRPARDSNTFELTVVDPGGFRIKTATIADAIVDEGYDVTIEAEGGLPPYEWTLVEGRLPPGLLSSINTVNNGLRIAGQPTEVGTSNLLVRVRDRQGREALQAFALTVVEPPPPPLEQPKDEGCACSGTAEPSPQGALAILALLGLTAFRRRRR